LTQFGDAGRVLLRHLTLWNDWLFNRLFCNWHLLASAVTRAIIRTAHIVVQTALAISSLNVAESLREANLWLLYKKAIGIWAASVSLAFVDGLAFLNFVRRHMYRLYDDPLETW
jgi:hypothetical protein